MGSHVFCLSCIKSMLQTQGSYETIKCPTCRADITLNERQKNELLPRVVVSKFEKYIFVPRNILILFSGIASFFQARPLPMLLTPTCFMFGNEIGSYNTVMPKIKSR